MLVVVSVSCCDDVVAHIQSHEPDTNIIKLHGGRVRRQEERKERNLEHLGERSPHTHRRK